MEAPEIRTKLPYNAEENPLRRDFCRAAQFPPSLIKASCAHFAASCTNTLAKPIQCLQQGVDPAGRDGPRLRVHLAQICFINSARAREEHDPKCHPDPGPRQWRPGARRCADARHQGRRGDSRALWPAVLALVQRQGEA